MIRAVASAVVACAALAVSGSACLSVQDFGPAAQDFGPVVEAGAGEGGVDSGAEGGVDDAEAAFVGTTTPRRWEWANPMPTGKALYGIGGTSSSDIWVAGEGGTIAHFNGAEWDVRYDGDETTRFYAVGTRAPNDVWVAGDANGQTRVVHYDGHAWTESYPFAGSKFHTFSGGPGPRLFAVTDLDVLELQADGTWAPTDGLDGASDVWVSASGDAWSVKPVPTFDGGTLLADAVAYHLAPGERTWKVVPLPYFPPDATVVALSGSGASIYVFYTDTKASPPYSGFIHFDGTTSEPSPGGPELPVDQGPHGARAACLNDGRCLLANGTSVAYASAGGAPVAYDVDVFPGVTALGMWSPDGSEAYAVGALGGFLRQASGDTLDRWKEVHPPERKDVLGVDVGTDGTTMAVTSTSLRVWNDGWDFPSGFGVPNGVVTVLARDDVWVGTGFGSPLKVTHYTGSWGEPHYFDPGPTNYDALAIWAPAKDDVWLSARESCIDFPPAPSGCSAPLKPFLWHFAGGTWTPVTVDAAYHSIHGTGPSDVWFAGDAVAHWDGQALTKVPSLGGGFTGVWSSAPGRVWLWGDHALRFDGQTATPIRTALNASSEWTVEGIAESSAGDVFVLTKRAVGSSLLWFDPSHTRLVEQLESDLELTSIRGRGDQLWAVGKYGATLRFVPAPVN